MRVTINLGAKLTLPMPNLDLYMQIQEAVTVHVPPTPDKAAINKCLAAVSVKYPEGDRTVELPRGFLPALTQGLVQAGYEPKISDNRRRRIHVTFGKTKYPMRPHQEEAIEAILEKSSGVIVAPPAAGKTVLALEAMKRSGQRSLVIVDRLNIMDQWVSRSKEFLGVIPVTIGGPGFLRTDELHEANIVIGMQQSLSTANGLEEKFFRSFGFVCLDECHHVSANTYLDVLQKFDSHYRIGLSATPYRDDGLDLVSKLVIGPIIYEVDDLTLQANKYIIKPKIERVHTSFKHPFWGTHRVKTHVPCDKPGCPKNGTAHGHKNNYMSVTKALVENSGRNQKIAEYIYCNRDKCNIVVSDRLAHLHALRELAIKLGFPEDRTHMLTGKESPKERAEVVRLAGYGSCAIFSTIAKEALDIPRLDRLHMCWPIKREHILEQQIGRITRTHPDKRDAIVYDYVDEGCSVLANQAWGRLQFYKQKKYQVNN